MTKYIIQIETDDELIAHEWAAFIKQELAVSKVLIIPLEEEED